jgi:hypothetical protein
MSVTERELEGGGRDVELRERYRELLEELRTVIPGLQVLFAFLLIAPFSSRFAEVDDAGHLLFVVALMAAAVAIVLFLTPTAYHRIAPDLDRDERIRLSVRLALGGLSFLAVSVASAVVLVARFVFGTSTGTWLGAAVFGLIALLWYGLPIRRRWSGPPTG